MQGVDFTQLIDGIVQGLLNGMGGVLQDAFDAWWNTSGPGAFGKLITAAFGVIVEAVWSLAGGALGNVNILTQLPPGWSYSLGPVVDMRDRLNPIAQGAVELALVVGILWAAASIFWGRPFARLLGQLPTYLLAVGGLLAAPQLIAWWIDVVNALSGALLDPDVGIPGLSHVSGFDRLSALGVLGLVYLVFALFYLLARIKLVVIVALLIVVAPLAIAAWAFPLPLPQRFASWWLSTFFGATFVQVLQAACLGLGMALMAQAVSGGGTAQDSVTAVALGTGSLLAAMAVPGMLLGSLARMSGGGGGGGMLGTALQVGMMLSGIGLAGAVAGRAVATAVPPLAGMAAGMPAAATITPIAPSGYVRSLLGGGAGPLLLPPPKP